jgi:hypothetical protein
MKELPPLTIPPGLRIGLMGTFNPKKGMKSTTAVIAANQCRDLAYNLTCWQHDRHDRLIPYGPVAQIEMAKASAVFGGDSAADLKGHEAFGEELEQLALYPDRLILLDSSGPASTMLPMIFKIGRFNSLLISQKCHAMLLVPFRMTLDVAEGALAMSRELRLVAPDHFVVPVPYFSESELKMLDAKHPAWTIFDEAEHGVIPLPLVSSSAAQGLERVPRSLTEIADPDSEDALQTIRRYTGYGRVEAGGVADAAASLVAAFDRAVAPMGFTPGA